VAIAPDHPGAAHYWIHVHEFGPTPEKALAAAERIASLAPGAGHLVHMPAHTYARLGRWNDAVAANRRAVEADLAYLRTAGADREYAAGYIAHNYHFLWSAALMAGEEGSAGVAAGVLAALAETQGYDGPRGSTLQHFRVLPLHTLVRFGRWDEILAAARPLPASSYTDATWRWARAMAFARTARTRQARAELAGMRSAMRDPMLARQEFKNTHSLAALSAIALGLGRAELALAEGRYAEAVSHARAALKAEDRLAPDEPEAWHMPSRQVLGAIYLASGRKPEAKAAFRDDLARHPANGWSLAGIAAVGGTPPAAGLPAGRY
jgi:tetratricopeptide (TPR) repeat protein